MKNPWSQASVIPRPSGKPHFARYMKARGDPKGIPRDPPEGRSRGDPG